MFFWTILFMLSNSWGATPSSTTTPPNCSCSASPEVNSCGAIPAFLSKDESEIARELGFDVPGDNVKLAKTAKGLALYVAFAAFLEKSDRSRMFYPEYYTRATQDASVLTLKSTFIPKNVTETDEYFRCTIPNEKYCLYRQTLRPYIGLAAKASGIDYSFLACQSYVESRFDGNARSSTGAIGYSQIQPANIGYLNEVLQRSIRNSSKIDRQIANTPGAREVRIRKVQHDIAKVWHYFWRGTKKVPRHLCKDDLTCYRHVFLAQALALKTDMLAFATSSSGIKADFDDRGDFRIEEMDKADSLLLLAGSYNLGVTKTIKLISQFCSGSTKLKDCLDKMKAGAPTRDVQSLLNYVMWIRDCSQQFSAEQIDFDDDQRWTEEVRTEKQNQQRENVTQCLLNPCPYVGK